MRAGSTVAIVRQLSDLAFAESAADSVRSEPRTVHSAVEIAAESEAIVKARQAHHAELRARVMAYRVEALLAVLPARQRCAGREWLSVCVALQIRDDEAARQRHVWRRLRWNRPTHRPACACAVSHASALSSPIRDRACSPLRRHWPSRRGPKARSGVEVNTTCCTSDVRRLR